MDEPIHFISYARDDVVKTFVDRLADELEKETPPLHAWIDRRQLKSYPHSGWPTQITRAITRSETFLYVLSMNSVLERSGWGSGCIGEVQKALNLRKLIIPLVLEHAALEQPDEVVTVMLGNRQRVYFTGSFEDGMGDLLRNLRWFRSPQGKLKLLEDQAYYLNYRLNREEDALSHANLERELEAVRADINDVRLRLAAELPAPALASSAAASSPFIAGAATQGVVGLSDARLAQYTAKRFLDRERDRASVKRFLEQSNKRILVIHGRSGIGKTSIAANAIKESIDSLPNPDQRPAFLYFSPKDRQEIGLALANLLNGLRVLAGPDRQLDADLFDAQLSTRHKLTRLLDCLGSRPVLALLDSFEEVPGDATELRQALSEIAMTPDPHGVKIVVTTQAPPESLLEQIEAGRSTTIRIDEGLPPEFARQLLKDLDNEDDGSSGLRAASDDLLTRAVVLTRGFPRALLAVHQRLSQGSSASLEELLHGIDGSKAFVLEKLVGEAFDHLPPDEQRVMQALAVYGQAVDPAAVGALVDPHLGGVDGARLLARLVKLRFVDSADRLYELHTSDREYALSTVPRGVPADRDAPPGERFTQFALLGQGARHFHGRLGPAADWRTRPDLDPALMELDLLYRGEQYDDGAKVLLDIDTSLMQWGHSAEVVFQHHRLRGRISDRALEARCLLSLSTAHAEMGAYERAIVSVEEALVIACADHDLLVEARCRHEIANARFYLNEIDVAVQAEEAALAIIAKVGAAAAADGRRLAMKVHKRLASCKTWQGRLEEASQHAARVLTLFQAVEPTGTTPDDRLQNNYALGISGIILHYQGDGTQAGARLRRALDEARGLHYRPGEGLHLANLAEYHVDRGEFETGCLMARESIKIADTDGLGLLRHWGRTALALGLLDSATELSDARLAAEKACEYDVPLNNAGAQTILGIVALRQGDRGAAGAAFHRAVATADLMLKRTPTTFTALDAKAIALGGLDLLDRTGVDAAVRALDASRAIGRWPGHDLRRRVLLDALAPADADACLAPLRARLPPAQ
ncbi:MAG TPA: TIR domain-containing protein [Polyangia bacterium]|jgi:tetratricopeptide (TPR) repeat protein